MLQRGFQQLGRLCRSAGRAPWTPRGSGTCCLSHGYFPRGLGVQRVRKGMQSPPRSSLQRNSTSSWGQSQDAKPVWGDPVRGSPLARGPGVPTVNRDEGTPPSAAAGLEADGTHPRASVLPSHRRWGTDYRPSLCLTHPARTPQSPPTADCAADCRGTHGPSQALDISREWEPMHLKPRDRAWGLWDTEPRWLTATGPFSV